MAIMLNRRAIFCLIGLIGLVLLAIGGLNLARIPRSAGITRERFERVEKGMSRDQIFEIVGGPPGDYTTRLCATMPHGIRYWRYKSWMCNEGQLLVRFDEQGIATNVVVCDVWLLQETFSERMRRLFDERMQGLAVFFGK